MNRLTKFVSAQYNKFKRNLTQIRDTPNAIAGGVAIGIFFGFTPLWGLKTLLAILAAWLFRFSKISAVLAVALHDILLPLIPIILRWQYQVGYYIISYPHHLPPKFTPKHLRYDIHSLISLKSLRLIIWPTLIGSIILGIPVAVAMYFVTLEIVARGQAARARLAARRSQGHPHG
ncbi:MAG: DUF2062 domain-containing protein [Chthoniobacteraceae bacterium]|jgi:uncharacterized protein